MPFLCVAKGLGVSYGHIFLRRREGGGEGEGGGGGGMGKKVKENKK